MSLIQVKLTNGSKAAIELYRSVQGFESINAYANRVLIPFILDNVPEASTIRCALSGFAIGSYLESEVAHTVRQSVIATGLVAYNDLLFSWKPADFVEAIESIIDDVAIRTMILHRKSPVMAGSRGKPTIESAPRPRQLMLLLNQLLYDVGMMRDKWTDSFEFIARLRKSAAVADIIAGEWSGDLDTASESGNGVANRFEDLYAGLVELDAKWQISRLKFTTKEQAALEQHRNSTQLDLDKLRAFVWSLVIYRDKHVDIEPTSSWTREAYRQVSFTTYDSNQRRENSNVWFEDKPSNRHIKHPASPRNASATPKAASKSKDPNRATFSSILGGLF